MENEMSNEKCGNCRFFEIEPMADDFNSPGTCRRSPPVFIGGDDDEMAWMQPLTHECTWCGEWRGVTILPTSKLKGVSVKDAGLTVRTRNALMVAGIFDFEAAARMSDEELMQCEKLGVKSLREIREVAAFMKSRPAVGEG